MDNIYLENWILYVYELFSQRNINIPQEEYSKYINVASIYDIINAINNLLINDIITEKECIELLEKYENYIGSSTIYIKKHNIILPNLINMQESNLKLLSIQQFASFMDKILLDHSNLNDTLNSFNSFNPNEKICFFSSNISEEYFIKMDFENYRYNIPKNFINKFTMCNIYDPSIRFYIIPLLLQLNDDGGHANILIIDNKNKSIEFFEPHGTIFQELQEYDIKHHIYNVLKVLFKNFKPEILNYTYVNVQQCVNIGVQALQNIINPDAGHCLAWTLLYSHIRLINIYSSSDDIIKFFVNTFTGVDLDMYMKRYISYVEKLGKFNIKKYSTIDNYKFILTDDEKDNIENKIIDYTEDFILNIDDKTSRHDILQSILKYKKYTDFHIVFSDTIYNSIQQKTPSPSKKKKKT